MTPVTYAGWEAIDAVERARGEEQGRPRVKLCHWDELLRGCRRPSQTEPLEPVRPSASSARSTSSSVL